MNEPNIKAEPVIWGDPKELSERLKLLYDLKIIDYKVLGRDRFSIGFSNDFTTFSRLYRDQIIEEAAKNMKGVMEITPFRKFDDESYITMYYATAFFTYLDSTRQAEKIDQTNEELCGDLVSLIEQINETFRNMKRGDKK